MEGRRQSDPALTMAALAVIAMGMEYIRKSNTGEIDFLAYQAYVESIRPKLLPHVYAFAADSRHFNVTSSSSLHDAWLESFAVREIASGERQEIRRMEISMALLGPFHDVRIHLHYTGVIRYSVAMPPRYENARSSYIAHGDLITHEIRLGHGGLLVHELLFESEAVFLIECSDIRHSEEVIKTD